MRMIDKAVLVNGQVYTSAANVADWLERMAESARRKGWSGDVGTALDLCANEWRKWALDNMRPTC